MKKIQIVGGLVIILGLIVVGGFWFFKGNLQDNPVQSCLDEKNQIDCYSQFLQLGIDSFSKELYEQSIDDFKLAQQVLDNDLAQAFGAFRNEANSLLELKKFDEAQKIYQDLIPTDHPDVARLYSDLIRLYGAQNKYEDGLKIAQEAYARFDDVYYLNKQANMLEELERYDEEIKVYERILELTPEEDRTSVEFKINKLKEVHGL